LLCHISWLMHAGSTVITKWDHAEGTQLQQIEVQEASHLVVDIAGVQATNRVLQLLQKHRDPRTLVLCLLSGGGSGG
jgi:Putative glycerate kinase